MMNRLQRDGLRFVDYCIRLSEGSAEEESGGAAGGEAAEADGIDDGEA